MKNFLIYLILAILMSLHFSCNNMEEDDQLEEVDQLNECCSCPEFPSQEHRLYTATELLPDLPDTLITEIRNIAVYQDNRIAFTDNYNLYLWDSQGLTVYDSKNSELDVDQYGFLRINDLKVNDSNQLFMLTRFGFYIIDNKGLRKLSDNSENLFAMEFLGDNQIILLGNGKLKQYYIILNQFSDFNLPDMRVGINNMSKHDKNNLIINSSEASYLFNGHSLTKISEHYIRLIDTKERQWSTFSLSDSLKVTSPDNTEQNYSVKDLGVRAGGFSRVFEDSNGIIWIFIRHDNFGSASFGGGLVKFSNQTWTSYDFFDQNNNDSYSYHSISEDSCGNLWYVLSTGSEAHLYIHPSS